MASLNGGFVGIDYEVTAGTQSEIITTFNASGTLTTAPRSTAVQYVIVAGGGGGGFGGLNGAGGGAGGYRSSVPGESSGGGASAEPLSPVTGGSPYPVVVGAGGAVAIVPFNFDSPTAFSSRGGTSSFNGVSTVGGGGSGDTTYLNPGVNIGGSGGGGLGYGYDGGTGTSGEGYPGGFGIYSNGSHNGGGGGGGAGAVGTSAPPSIADNIGFPGGDGVASSITGSPVYRAGGGGGTGRFWATTQGFGGAGGGGNGAFYNSDGSGTIPAPLANPTAPAGSPGQIAASGATNTGGGGGGCSIGTATPDSPAGLGGSGVVIIKEPAVSFIENTSGVWSMEAVYANVSAGTWT